MTQSKTHGVHHAGLTVPHLGRAQRFFTDALGFEVVAEKPDYPAVFVSDGAVMLTLWQADEGARPGDRKKSIGLHHLALKVASPDALGDLHRTLAARDDVQLEFAPESLGDGPVQHMMFFIEGNIRLELIAA